MSAYLFLQDKRRKRRYYEQLHLLNLGTSGDVEKIKDQMRKWEREF